jgi:hypothetical protein
MQKPQVEGRHRSSSERFDIKSFVSSDKISVPPSSGKQGEVLEWLQKVEFGPSGIWRAQEAMKISAVLCDAHNSIQEFNSNRAEKLRSRLQKSHERVEQLKSRMVRAERSLRSLSQAPSPDTLR